MTPTQTKRGLWNNSMGGTFGHKPIVQVATLSWLQTASMLNAGMMGPLAWPCLEACSYWTDHLACLLRVCMTLNDHIARSNADPCMERLDKPSIIPQALVQGLQVQGFQFAAPSVRWVQLPVKLLLSCPHPHKQAASHTGDAVQAGQESLFGCSFLMNSLCIHTDAEISALQCLTAHDTHINAGFARQMVSVWCAWEDETACEST